MIIPAIPCLATLQGAVPPPPRKEKQLSNDKPKPRNRPRVSLDEARPEKRFWTVLHYMAGDNDLEEAGAEDIGEMLRAGGSSRAHVVVQFDRYSPSHLTRRFVIPDRPGMTFEELEKQSDPIPEGNTGDPKVLSDFLGWGRTTYPSHRRALILWNHGDGWRPVDLEEAARRVHRGRVPPPRLFHEGRPRRGAFRTLLGHRHALFVHPRAILYDMQGVVSNRAIGYDFTSRNDALDTIELRKALGRGRVDLLGCDACLMAQLEVAYELRDHVSILVASEQNEPGEGWPYHQILPALHHPAPLSPEALGVHIAKAYISHWKPHLDEKHDLPLTQSVLRLEAIGDLAQAAEDLAETLIPAIKRDRGSVVPVVYGIQRYGDKSSADLGHLARRALKHLQDPPVQKAAQRLLDQLRHVVAYSGAIGIGARRTTGVAVYFPSSAMDLHWSSRSYDRLAFGKDHPRWLDFLYQMLTGESNRPPWLKRPA